MNADMYVCSQMRHTVANFRFCSLQYNPEVPGPLKLGEFLIAPSFVYRYIYKDIHPPALWRQVGSGTYDCSL